jgi:hypothetical protein
MVELMSIKIGVGRHISIDWDKNSDEDTKAKSEEPEEELSPLEASMSRVLQQKKQEVVMALISKVSSGNDDFESCLNA